MLEFHIALSEILLTFHDGGCYHIETSPANQWTGFYMITASVMKGLTACAYQLIYNLSLIKLSSACAKQTAGVNASDLVKQRASSLILNFEEVLKSFLV